jgi:hypothetical protein
MMTVRTMFNILESLSRIGTPGEGRKLSMMLRKPAVNVVLDTNSKGEGLLKCVFGSSHIDMSVVRYRQYANSDLKPHWPNR